MVNNYKGSFIKENPAQKKTHQEINLKLSFFIALIHNSLLKALNILYNNMMSIKTTKSGNNQIIKCHGAENILIGESHHHVQYPIVLWPPIVFSSHAVWHASAGKDQGESHFVSLFFIFFRSYEILFQLPRLSRPSPRQGKKQVENGLRPSCLVIASMWQTYF